MKPRLRKVAAGCLWSCALGNGPAGYGKTAAAAYRMWLTHRVDPAAMTYEGASLIEAIFRDDLRAPMMELTFPTAQMLTGTGFAVEPRRLPADPCPQCMPGGTCATVICGRKCSSDLMRLYGAPLGASTEPGHRTEVK